MDQEPTTAGQGPRWQPLAAIDRRVVGVLVEKAKTTPDGYPMSLSALTAGCNQKSNRAPLMQVVADDVAESLDRLRGFAAVAEIHGDGRIARYKHRLYEWLGVDKVEMAVMAELLLRGAQTVGELRGRAARMEPIADLAALRPVLDSLVSKKLVIYLTSPQRGAVVTHTLFGADELQRLHREHDEATLAAEPALASAGGFGVPPEAPTSQRPLIVTGSRVDEPGLPSPASAGGAGEHELASLRRQVGELAGEVGQLRSALDEATDQLRRDLDDLRRQLGG